MKIWRAVYGTLGVAIASAEVELPLLDIPVEKPTAPSANGTCEDLRESMPPRTEPAVVLQVVSEGYLPVQKNFIRLMEANSRLTREHIYLFCLDETSEREIMKMGIRCTRMMEKWTDALSFLWKMRIKVLSCLLEIGYNVILSDSDALWLKDPIQDFDSPLVRGSSIVASRGSFPRTMQRDWGSTLCMGFIFFRACPCIKTVLISMKRFVIRTGDDQRSINLALRELGVEWDESSDMRYVQSTDFGRGTINTPGDCSLNVTLLPHSKYTRDCRRKSTSHITTVAHCRSGKNGDSKTRWMERQKLWYIDDAVDGEHDEVQVNYTSKIWETQVNPNPEAKAIGYGKV